MRVLFVTNMWPDEERPWYGAFVHSQAGSLRALGVEVDALPIRGYATRRAYVSAARSLARLPAGRYDVVHAHYGHSGMVGRLQFGAPLLLSYCGDDLLGTVDDSGGVTRRSAVEASVFRQLSRFCDATITKSHEMACRLPPSCLARNSVIPNGVDLERFRPAPQGDARRAVGWSDEESVVLFVGDPRLAVKNFELAQATLACARKRVPGARLHVLWGARPTDVPTMMCAADALLVTSRSEGSPNVVKEAMASELPVVSTPVGDVQERLRGVAGCHVRPPRADLLAEALVSALDGGRAPEARRAVACLSTDAVARRILALYRELAGRSHRHGGRQAQPERRAAC